MVGAVTLFILNIENYLSAGTFFVSMARGRPIGSPIRQNIITLLTVIGKPLYGYLIHKIYVRVFVPCTRENIYYHLKKGVALGEFDLTEVKLEKGQYSWGGTVEKHYFSLGKNAHPTGVSEEIQQKIRTVAAEVV